MKMEIEINRQYFILKIINNMEKEKFYTPEIGELHVGLECQIHEYSDMNEESFEDCVLNNIILKNILELSIVNKHLDDWLERTIRIKYLDNQDIESLGFIESKLQNRLFLFKNKIDLGKRGVNLTIGLNTNYINSHTIIFAKPDDKPIEFNFNLFVGKIKNKSELKRILKQIAGENGL